MRATITLLALLGGATLAGGAAAAVFPSGPAAQRQVAVSEADALAKCGVRPPSPGTWQCVGRPDNAQSGGHSSGGGGGAGKITWTWTAGGAPATGGSAWGATPRQ
jgi:hypothetical protein